MAFALVFLAAACRLLPHPWNFTPVLAVALFGGANLPKRSAWLTPLLALFLSDLALGYPFSWMNLVCYSCFLFAVAAGQWLRASSTWKRRLGAACAGSLLFYVVTNFAVWAGSSMYAHTTAGLLQCYGMALPFFRNSLAGDLFWTAAIFGVYDRALYHARAGSPRLAVHKVVART